MAARRALFVSTAVPPLPESQTIRNAYLLRGLARAGFVVDVVAPADGEGDATLLDLLPPGVRLFRTGPAVYDRLQSLVRRIPRPAGPFVRSAIAIGAGHLVAPDVRRDWALKAIKTARAIPGLPPALLVSSAGSYTAHIAAAQLAASWGAPWLADYGDPWSFNPIRPASLPHIRWQNERLERVALRRCTAISVTTEETAALYRGWLDGRLPVHVVPCGFTDYALPVPDARSADAPITIAYVGSASRGTRDLRAFLRAFAVVSVRAARPLRFEIVGASSPSFAAEAQRLRLTNVYFTGWVSYSESLRRMHSADLLLLIGNAAPLQVPAKVFNYAASGVPIVYLGQLPRDADPTMRLMERWPGVVHVDAWNPELPAVLRELLDGLAPLRAAAGRRAALPEVQRYEWDAIGDEFAHIAEVTAEADRTLVG
jgi:hypothetical protein